MKGGHFGELKNWMGRLLFNNPQQNESPNEEDSVSKWWASTKVVTGLLVKYKGVQPKQCMNSSVPLCWLCKINSTVWKVMAF